MEMSSGRNGGVEPSKCDTVYGILTFPENVRRATMADFDLT
jgi:hypothetical protein